MLDKFGATQKELLKTLLKKKAGMSADEVASGLGITRTAVKQHLNALVRLGYIEPGPPQETGGRPSQTYKLTLKGFDLFPKRYSWFSELMLEAIRNEKGAEGLRDWLSQIGVTVGSNLKNKVEGLPMSEKLQLVVDLMNSLAYEAEIKSGVDGGERLEATNCVYHALARRFPEICEFDLSLLRELTGSGVQHESCMLRGSDACRFSFNQSFSNTGKD